MPLDPFSALGLAANIVQFIDFSCGLISDAKEIYHSATGATANNVGLQGIAESLSRLSSTLVNPLHPTSDAVSAAEREIVKIAASSRDIGDEMLATIQSLKLGEGSHRKWRSFRQALSTTWKRDKIAHLHRRLEDARSNLSIHVLSYISVRQNQVLQSLENARTECLEVDSVRSQRIEPMLESLRSLVQRGQDLTREHLTLIDQKLCDSNDKATNLLKEASVLKGLLFERMTARYTAIVEAHQNTFQWIFEPSRWPPCDPRSRILFHEWLTYGDGIYWISGKPGSGKSTLMKYLRDCPQTVRCLQVWANGARLAMAGFFFWIAGTDMQKSQRGLLQQVLFEILRNFPDWIPIICPERWAASRHGFQAEWSLSELNEAFSKLGRITVDRENHSKLCIFVDGLDEYHGDPLDLLKTIRNIAQIDNVKVCVSSRPWNCFEDAFGKDIRRKLCLHDLTRDDIAIYVREKLEEIPSFSPMKRDGTQIELLISETVSRAQGVFLWVYLVMRSLREGLFNGDSLSILYERLLEMPSDLEEFFENLIKSVDNVYRKRMAHTFRVALAASSPLPLLLYTFIDESDRTVMRHPGIVDSAYTLHDREIIEREETMCRQLNGRYKGLLESTGLPGSKAVDFLHRTVRDFLATRSMQDLLASYSAHNFNAAACICEASIQQIKAFPAKNKLVNLDDFIEFAQRIEKELHTTSIPLLDHMNHIFYAYTPLLRDKLDFDGGSPTSLLGKAIWSGHLSYVRSRLRRQPNIFSSHGGRPLLMTFLRGFSRSGPGIRQASYYMAELLLKNGANPNGTVDGMPLLHALLTDCCIEENHGSGNRNMRLSSMTNDGPSATEWFSLFLSLLLRHGARFRKGLAQVGWGLRKYLLDSTRWDPKLTALVLDTYRLLFNRGLDPNAVMDLGHTDGISSGRTLWGHLLLAMKVYADDTYVSKNHTYEGDKSRVGLMILFLQRGADPFVVIDFPGFLSATRFFGPTNGQLKLEFTAALEHAERNWKGPVGPRWRPK
ncbi:hypothetical protein AYL99_11458 [Fonsecaea erecta]|uniref:NACHT domain-containing protein n=1 Tax=Fonsecaea erecta TaxID=1367422 RepID=A0A178Z3L9_9EURO|nr:hypothetical protein AYL99_11458 [Fonsecaea erecta]OAP54357.1 hypothetical protein AYL99_11458 [Fonsecaea erecta]